ncbi:MAG: hypothetical protein KDJ35_08100 [Alphaproteobacteria bacterium]|nr:hypothetical protein [Alphaproteobacteria bacterium]
MSTASDFNKAPKSETVRFIDIAEAKKAVLGQSTLYCFYEDSLEMSVHGAKREDGSFVRPSHEFSQSHRSVEAGMVQLLLKYDPSAEQILVEAKEALTDEIAIIAENLSDLSADPLWMNLPYLGEQLAFIENLKADKTENYFEEEDHALKIAADIMLGQELYKDEEGFEPLSDYAEEYPDVLKFLAEQKDAIARRLEEKKQHNQIHEKFWFEPRDALKSDGFWESVRITISVEKALLEKIKSDLTNQPELEQTI